MLRNIAALAQFTNPTRLPPFPPYRSWVLMRAMWRAYRIPARRPWVE